MVGSVFGFVGLAMVYGALASLVFIFGLYLFKHPRPWQLFPLLVTTLGFVFLTQHPFPSPQNLVCPVPSAQPQLLPFDFIKHILRLRVRDATILEYLTNRALVAAAMNFFFCMAVGLALGRHTTRARMAVLYGAALTLGIELTQLTGTWGLFPCAYRQFNVDDLILNLSGVITGAMVMSRWRRTAR